MSILITGGAGYIGSHTAAKLLESKKEIVILDSLEKGHKEAVCGGEFYHGDIRDEEFLDKVFKENDIEAVVHFAAYSLVGESVNNPAKYYNNNVVSSLRLLEKMKEFDVKKLVFSSTAAVFGEPENIPIKEDDVTNPTNPYGETKLTIEKMLKWYDEAYGIKNISLRYFNAAGAHPSGEIGEDHNPETHLIPIVIDAAMGKRESIKIFGDDYPTPDGTCIRDYIHVMDLADAHELALKSLLNGENSAKYNLGSGNGFSVKEIVKTVENVTGETLKKEFVQRREGDPAILVASSEKISKEFGWKPEFSKIEDIVETAWKWHKGHPGGYSK